MTTLGENLRTKLLEDVELRNLVGNRVHQNHVPQRGGDAYIYFAVDSTQEDETIDGAAGSQPLSTTFAVECIAIDSQAKADAIKARVRTLNKYRGAMGTATAKGVFVTDYQEEYHPRGLGADAGGHVAVCQVQVFA